MTKMKEMLSALFDTATRMESRRNSLIPKMFRSKEQGFKGVQVYSHKGEEVLRVSYNPNDPVYVRRSDDCIVIENGEPFPELAA